MHFLLIALLTKIPFSTSCLSHQIALIDNLPAPHLVKLISSVHNDLTPITMWIIDELGRLHLLAQKS